MKPYIFLFLFFVSCQPAQQEFITVLNIQNVFTNKKKLNLSEIASGVDYIKLETGDNCLIGKIKKIVVFSNSIIVYDEQVQNILVFDKKGKFQNRIGNNGKGPGEYIQISDMAVNPSDSTVCLLDDIQMKFLKFKLNNRLVMERYLGTNPDKLSFIGGKPIVQYNTPDFTVYNDQYSLTVYDDLMKPAKRLLNRSGDRLTPRNAANMSSHSRSFFNYVNDTLTFWECRVDTVYKIVLNQAPIKKYYLQYGNKLKFTDGYTYRNFSNFSEIDWLIETKHYFFMRAAYNDDYLRILFIKHKNTGFSIDGYEFKNDLDTGISFFPEGIACPEVLFKTFSAFDLKTEMAKKKITVTSARLAQLIEDAEYVDNPCIMLVTLK